MSYLLIRIRLKIKPLFSEMLKYRQRKNSKVLPHVKSSNTLTTFTMEAQPSPQEPHRWFLTHLLQRSWECVSSYGCNITKSSVSTDWGDDSKPRAKTGEKTLLPPHKAHLLSFTEHLSMLFLFQADRLRYPTKYKVQLRCREHTCLSGGRVF